MQQKPYNDNLVMASIKNLYEQASYVDRPHKNNLQRNNPKNLPIIGSLPVQIGFDEEKNPLNDIVLAGRLQPAFSDENYATTPTIQRTEDCQKDNQFLAIRQAVIAAGQNKGEGSRQSELPTEVNSAPEISETDTSKTKLSDEVQNRHTEQTFAGELANLIDFEIERRLEERSKNKHRPNSKKPTAKQTHKTKRLPDKKLIEAKQKTAQRPKRKAEPKVSSKKTSTKKRK